MTTLVAALVLASAVMHASWNALLKGREGDPLAASAGLSLVWALVGLPLLFVVAPVPEAAWPHLGLSVVAHLVYFALLVTAYRGADLSTVYPIARGLPPLFVVVGAWALVGETPTLLGALGVLCIGGGVVSVGLATRRRDDDDDRRVTRSIGLAVATAVFIAGYTLIDGVGVRVAGGVVSYLVWLTAIQGTLFALGALAIGGRPLAREVWQRRGTALLTGVLSAGGYAVALWAMVRAPIALVAALRETAVLFAAIIGFFVLREPFGRRRIVAAAVVAAGAVLVRLGG